MVLADSLDAAFRAKRVSAATYVAGMVALVNHDTWDVSDAAMTQLEDVIDIIDSSKLPAVEEALQQIVKPRFASLSGATDSGNQLLQQRMQRFLIVVAKDSEMRKPLAQQAARRLGLNGEPDPKEAPAGELQTIFTVGVQDLGQPFFELLLQAAKDADDPAFRNAATGALARVEDPALVKQLQASVLAGDFKGTEMLQIVNRQMVRDATTELTYAWIRENDATIIERIPETFRSSTVPGFGSAFCSNERAEDWQAFIESHADKLPGYQRSLAQATETARLCAGLREASEEDLLAAFAEY